MITDVDYVAWLRARHNCFDVLNLIHLSQLGPGWYHLPDVAERLGLHRSNLNTSMIRLREKGLICYTGSRAGTFLWWIKSSPTDEPNPKRDAPRWVLKDLETGKRVEVLVGAQAEWAEAQQISAGTMRNFLAGRIKRLLGRYEMLHGPMQCEEMLQTV